VFDEYIGRKAATTKEFDVQGYFKTGDIAAYSPEVRTHDDVFSVLLLTWLS
jgi:long-subunit acyl-CoA synthetase (AMP-forming)